jgi:hypothetical protein
MFAILLETGSETGLFRAFRYDSRRRFRRALELLLGARALLHPHESWHESWLARILPIWEALQTMMSGGFLADKRVFRA